MGDKNNRNEKVTHKKCKCFQCEFYNKKKDCCEVSDTTKCSQKNILECKDFLVKEELTMF